MDYTTDLSRLAMTPEAVSALPRHARETRVHALIQEAHHLAYQALANLVLTNGHQCAGTVIMFSGGNDSTVLAHLFRKQATHAAHANTGVGIEETRQFVRDTCSTWGLPLIERAAPRIEDSYEVLVRERGFPGPGQHYKMYQRLKERAFRKVRSDVLGNRSPRKWRVLFLAGRRRTESEARADVPEYEREGSIVWCSPLVNWTKPDLTTYRSLFPDCPRNQVADLIHMSGECLCGAYAHKGERAEISAWYPAAFESIAKLEAEIANDPKIANERRRWGWGSTHKPPRRNKKASRACGRCEQRLLFDAPATTA